MNINHKNSTLPCFFFLLFFKKKEKEKRETEKANRHFIKFYFHLVTFCSLTSQQFVPDPSFEEVKDFVKSGVFGPCNYDELIGSLEGNEGFGRADYFLVGKDFPSYIECQEEVDKAYHDQKVSFTRICSISLLLKIQVRTRFIAIPVRIAQFLDYEFPLILFAL